jgi:exodeoxyribonuclease-3
MIIASWNVNSLNVRLPHVLDWLAKQKPDVLCIQETKLTDEKFPKSELEDAGYHCEFFGEKAYNGVAILSRSTPDAVQKGFPDEVASDSKRFLEIRLGSLRIIDVYIPNGQAVGSDKFHYKLKWIERLKVYLNNHHDPQGMTVICGDFNVALENRDVYNPEELTGQILFSDEEKNAVNTLKDWGFVDTFRQHNEESGLYTWWDYRMMAFRRKMGMRIDHIWATAPLAQNCKRSWVDVEPRKLEKPSDHAPVCSEFDG